MAQTMGMLFGISTTEQPLLQPRSADDKGDESGFVVGALDADVVHASVRPSGRAHHATVEKVGEGHAPGILASHWEARRSPPARPSSTLVSDSLTTWETWSTTDHGTRTMRSPASRRTSHRSGAGNRPAAAAWPTSRWLTRAGRPGAQSISISSTRPHR